MVIPILTIFSIRNRKNLLGLKPDLLDMAGIIGGSVPYDIPFHIFPTDFFNPIRLNRKRNDKNDSAHTSKLLINEMIATLPLTKIIG
jgi:hypothetical protein